MPDVWLTIAEIARRLGRPPATVSYWRDVYRPERRADDAGRAVYRLDTFERIAMLDRRRRSADDIRRALEEGVDVPEGYEAAVLRELRAIRAVVERIADRLERDDPRP